MSTPKRLPTPRKAREAIGLSPTELSKAVPCCLATVYTCENARRFPGHRTLRAAYLRALGLTTAAHK